MLSQSPITAAILMLMQFLRRNFWLILALLVAVWAGRYLLTPQHFYTHDDMQVFRVNEFVACLTDGQIPCRWSSELGKGYGYPLFNYYPPMIYLIPGLLHLAGLPIILSLNLMSFASFLLAGLGVYLLVLELTKRPELSMLASVLYTLYPFHAINVFIRGVYGENIAWSLLPWLILSLYRMTQAKRFSLTLTLLLTTIYLTHLLSSFVVTGILLALAIYWRGALRLGKHVIIALAVAAFSFLPALVEKPLVQADSLVSGYYAYTNHFVSFFQLFKEYKWNYSASLWSEAWDEMPYMVGHLHTLSILTSGVILLVVIWQKRRNLKGVVLDNLLPALLLAMGFAFLLLAHFKSDPLWQLLPPLQYYQFPWRFIGWAGLPLILGVTLILKNLPKKIMPVVVLLTTVTLVIYSLPFFRPRGYDSYQDADYLSGTERNEQQVKSLFDYLPQAVQAVPEGHATHPAGAIRTSHSYELTLTQAQAGPYTLPVFNYPGWKGYIDGVEVELTSSVPHGLITLELPSGQSTIKLKFVSTPVRTVGNAISVIAMILLIISQIRTRQGRIKKS